MPKHRASEAIWSTRERDIPNQKKRLKVQPSSRDRDFFFCERVKRWKKHLSPNLFPHFTKQNQVVVGKHKIQTKLMPRRDLGFNKTSTYRIYGTNGFPLRIHETQNISTVQPSEKKTPLSE